MYACRDLAYTIAKGERGADANLIVLGEDHRLHMQQLSLILETAGKAAPDPIYYSYIMLKEGKMSTREGKVVLLSEFLDEAASRAAEKVDEQCRDLDDAERSTIAEKVAVAAVRFAILRVGSNKNVVFDWETSLSFTGDTGPYVQYSCARISSILRKFGAVPADVSDEFPVETDQEWALLTKLSSFGETVANATRQRTCAPVAPVRSGHGPPVHGVLPRMPRARRADRSPQDRPGPVVRGHAASPHERTTPAGDRSAGADVAGSTGGRRLPWKAGRWE